ncbi:MAG: DUF4407 domain-containing protein, partial [Bacteroidetes bacterium]|nr:DUF4407 domain-containing protein [Bacteroidota bacterium]
IGATIFLTACMAVISGSFAIYSLIQNRIIAFFFGLLWGAMIFNLDRYIVSSIRKEGKTWHELGLALPRLILAVLISVVITKPIEVELFSNQINSEMFHYTTQLEKEAEMQLDDRLGLDSIRVKLQTIDSVRMEYKKLKEGKPTSFDFGEVSAEYKTSKTTYDSLVNVYTPRIKANEARRNYLWNKYATKVFADDGSGEKKFVRWDFPQKWQETSNQLYKINKRLQEEIDEQAEIVKKLEGERRGAREAFAQGIDEELKLLQVQRDELVLAKDEKEAIRKSQIGPALEKARKYGIGFPAKIQVLEKMKEDDSSIWWMSNLIVLLFILLETSPVFVKLITKRGPYDYLLSRIEHHKKVESLRYISDMNYDLNATMQLQSRKQMLNGTNGTHQGEEVFSEN